MLFRLIKNETDFFSLRKAWADLLMQSSDPSVTQSWEWMHTWWQIYGKGRRDLHVICAYKNDRLVGIAPFSAERIPTNYYGVIRFRTLWLLGCGPVKGRSVVSDYLNLIVLKGLEDAFIQGLMKHLCHNGDWDEIILENVNAESDVPGLLKENAHRTGLTYTAMDTTRSIIAKLPNTWDEYINSISGSLRYKIRRGRKEFSRIGGTYYLVKEQRELPKAFADLERLHQHRWRSKGIAGAFSSCEWKSFHRKLMSLLLEKDQLKLSFLKLDNQPVAANYNFVFDNKIHFFQSGLIPHQNKHIRLGLLLHSYCIQEAINEGFKEYDFLQIGASGAGYKKMWENYSRDLLDIRICRCSNRENVYRLLTRISDFARKAKHVFETKISHHLT